jgi:hypothetical protein
VLNLSAASHQAILGYKSESTAATAYIRTSRLLVIKF